MKFTSRRSFLSLIAGVACLPYSAWALGDPVYSAEITHNDIHDMEFCAEKLYKHIRYYYGENTTLVAAFKLAYQSSYDFHSHMHSDDEEDHVKTVSALKPVIEAMKGLKDVTVNTELYKYFEELDVYFANLELDIPPVN